MKYLYILLSLLIFALSSTDLHSQLYVGVKVGTGPSFYKFPGKTGPSAEFEKNAPKYFNFLAGIMVEYPVFAGFSIQPEIQYLTKGARRIDNRTDDPAFYQGHYFSDINNSNENQHRNGVANEGETFFLPDLYRDIEVKMNYLDIPILLKYEFFGGGQGFYVETGMAFSFGLKGTISAKMKDINDLAESENALYDWNGNEVYNYSDLLLTYPVSDQLQLAYDPFKENDELFLKKSETSFIIGGGSYFEIGLFRLYADLRYLHGISNLNAQTTQKASKVNSRSVQLSATLLYPIGL